MRAFVLLLASLLLASCATQEVETTGPPTTEQAYAVTVTKSLVRFNAGQPQKLLSTKQILGLSEDERLVGLCYRGANRQLYALGASGQLYRINPTLSQVSLVGRPIKLPARASGSEAQSWSLALEPGTDRLRVVGSAGANLSVAVDSAGAFRLDAALSYETKDRNAGHTANIVALAYGRGKEGESVAYGLDAKRGVLVRVSGNTGKLVTVGELGMSDFGPALLTIAEASHTAYAIVREEQRSKWYRIDLATGHASFIGTIPAEATLVGATIAP